MGAGCRQPKTHLRAAPRLARSYLPAKEASLCLNRPGNSVLGNFGMSLDNFKAEKDPNTGSYNISFNP